MKYIYINYILIFKKINWERESHPQPSDYKSVALPLSYISKKYIIEFLVKNAKIIANCIHFFFLSNYLFGFLFYLDKNIYLKVFLSLIWFQWIIFIKLGYLATTFSKITNTP